MIQTISTATAEIGIQCELLLPPTLETESSSQSMQNVQATSTPNIQENSINFVPVCMSETTNSEPIQMQTDDDPFASINTPKYKSVGNPSMIYDLMQQMKSQPSQMDSTPTLSFTTDGMCAFCICTASSKLIFNFLCNSVLFRKRRQ